LIDKIVNERRGSTKDWLILHDRSPALTGGHHKKSIQSGNQHNGRPKAACT